MLLVQDHRTPNPVQLLFNNAVKPRILFKLCSTIPSEHAHQRPPTPRQNSTKTNSQNTEFLPDRPVLTSQIFLSRRDGLPADVREFSTITPPRTCQETPSTPYLLGSLNTAGKAFLSLNIPSSSTHSRESSTNVQISPSRVSSNRHKYPLLGLGTADHCRYDLSRPEQGHSRGDTAHSLPGLSHSHECLRVPHQRTLIGDMVREALKQCHCGFTSQKLLPFENYKPQPCMGVTRTSHSERARAMAEVLLFV